MARLVQAGAAILWLLSASALAKPLKLVVLGDSLSAGYGLKAGDGFTDQLAAALKGEKFDVDVVNAGVSGDTAEDALARYDWSVPADADAILVELGANDMLRAMPIAPAKAALAEIVQKAKAANAKVLIAGMRAPANLPQDYRGDFERMYRDVATSAEVPLYPFFLEGVAGDMALNQGDGMHPNPAGVAIVVKGILPSVEDLLRSVVQK